MDNGIMEWLLSMQYGNDQEMERKRMLEEQQKMAMLQQGQRPQQRMLPQGGDAMGLQEVGELIRRRRQQEENALRF